ncbi:MAG: hypothetical protein RMJ31_07260 [Nitrososphaerota archaeon]|nr:hypothetical protein [Nitrososphaerota archaeon]
MVLYGKVEIKDLNGNTYTLGDENRGYYLSLHNDEASSLTIHIVDPQDVFKDRYVVGGEVIVYCDSSNPPVTRVFNGIIESVRREDKLGLRYLEIHATEKFYVRIMSRLICETFSNMKVGAIVRALLQKYTPEFDVSNVQDTDVEVKSIRFNYRPLKECLNMLSELAHANYYCDAYGKVYFYPKESIDQNLVIDDAMLIPTPSALKDLSGVKTVIIVQGGISLTLDQSQENTSSYVSLHDRDVALRFTPTRIKARYLELYLEKVGNPPDRLSGVLVQDLNNSPTGPEVAHFGFSKESISTPRWYACLLQANLDTTKSYWLIVRRIGDANNTYRWYHNNATNDTHAERTDGSWIVYNGNSWRPAFRFYAGGPVLAKAIDPIGVAKYGYREEIVTREDIVRTEDARRIAYEILAEKSRVRFELQKLRVRGLSKLPQVGKLADLRIPSLNFEGKVLIEDVDVSFRAGDEYVDEVLITVGEDPESLAQTLQVIEEKLEEEKRKSLAFEEAQLNLCEAMLESFKLLEALYVNRNKPRLIESFTIPAETLRATVQASGTFQIGVAKIGYADLG